MTALFIFLHVVSCILLVVCVLMQSGRGGGLTDGFASAESMFGAKTNEFMVRITTILGCIFLVTSLTLAYFSAQKEESLMNTQTATQTQTEKKVEPPVKDTAPAADAKTQ